MMDWYMALQEARQRTEEIDRQLQRERLAQRVAGRNSTGNAFAWWLGRRLENAGKGLQSWSHVCEQNASLPGLQSELFRVSERSQHHS